MVAVTLVKGRTYRQGNNMYERGVEKQVDQKTAQYLRGTGRFTVGGESFVPAVEKERPARNHIKLSDKIDDKIKKAFTRMEAAQSGASELPKNSDNEFGIPNFRSKDDLAAYAEETFGVTLGITKMAEMRETLINMLSKSQKELAANKAKTDAELEKGAVDV